MVSGQSGTRNFVLYITSMYMYSMRTLPEWGKGEEAVVIPINIIYSYYFK